jgi:coenzyme F420 hydrogenase subunit beta
MTSKLGREVEKVVRAGNCSGCGGCALISDRVHLGLSSDGFMRPRVGDGGQQDRAVDASEAALFRRICPGKRLVAPVQAAGTRSHPILGRYVEAWQGWAADEVVRGAGSSGGVLTAISEWMISTGRAPAVRASGASTAAPTRTVSVRITTREEALAAAGSRYAPVSNASRAVAGEPFVGKPCEVAAVRNVAAERGGDGPVLLSFFCAGTPSQLATDRLVEELGGNPSSVAELRYRGDGWPGMFKFRSTDGTSGEMSYQQSWGKRLGRTVQTRCKLCVDGTGEYADIAVGDYWESDRDGFPVFDDAMGNSVVIARTERGARLLREAAADGVVVLAEVDLDDVAQVQPLQRLRRSTLAGRLLGRALAGRRVPRYRGFGLLDAMTRNARANVKAAVGMFTRTVGLRH